MKAAAKKKPARVLSDKRARRTSSDKKPPPPRVPDATGWLFSGRRRWEIVSFLQKHVCCRRAKCRVCRGKAYAHGPYWYASWRDEKGKTKTTYVGKSLPDSVRQGRQSTGCDCKACKRGKANDDD